ncbi:SDR family NAD(P)-dependent oxidoreductase [Mycobacterium sp. smrl_JER01]|uniref:SDR family NAD(P)-dependent oxidoreductase n=1 Tax=Mycobacterium sp. smrl_JER01 TaxID=3402633 RepID=UPI003AD563AD
MDYLLSKKTAIVTGGASGIGLETANQLLAEGANVLAVDLDVAPLVSRQDPQLRSFQCDLTDSNSAPAATAAALEAFGSIDVLISCAGIAPVRSSALAGTDADWQHTLDVNFLSIVRMCREVVPHMKAANAGSIVSVASDAGRMPDPFFAEYNVSKAAILMFMKALSIELGGTGIRANSVSPGPVRTPMWDRPGGFGDSVAESFGMEKEAAIQHFAVNVRKLPLARLGTVAEVAAVNLFLASPLSSFVTGAEYTVNGGSIPTV